MIKDIFVVAIDEGYAYGEVFVIGYKTALSLVNRHISHGAEEAKIYKAIERDGILEFNREFPLKVVRND